MSEVLYSTSSSTSPPPCLSTVLSCIKKQKILKRLRKTTGKRQKTKKEKVQRKENHKPMWLDLKPEFSKVFLSIHLVLKTTRPQLWCFALWQKTLMGLNPLARIDNVGKSRETVPVFHLQWFQSKQVKNFFFLLQWQHGIWMLKATPNKNERL